MTNWPPIEGLPNPDFKYKLFPVKIDMKVAGVPRISRTQRCSNTHVDVLFTQRVNSNEKQKPKIHFMLYVQGSFLASCVSERETLP